MYFSIHLNVGIDNENILLTDEGYHDSLRVLLTYSLHYRGVSVSVVGQ